MMITATCTRCGSDQIALEQRDWFGDEPVPPREAYGPWLVCTKCGNSWPDDEGEILW